MGIDVSPQQLMGAGKELLSVAEDLVTDIKRFGDDHQGVNANTGFTLMRALQDCQQSCEQLLRPLGEKVALAGDQLDLNAKDWGQVEEGARETFRQLTSDEDHGSVNFGHSAGITDVPFEHSSYWKSDSSSAVSKALGAGDVAPEAPGGVGALTPSGNLKDVLGDRFEAPTERPAIGDVLAPPEGLPNEAPGA